MNRFLQFAKAHRPPHASSARYFSLIMVLGLSTCGCQSVAPHVLDSNVLDDGDELESLVTCSDICEFANDGVCDDGGADSFSKSCALGTDCSDCGERVADSASDSYDIATDGTDNTDDDADVSSNGNGANGDGTGDPSPGGDIDDGSTGDGGAGAGGLGGGIGGGGVGGPGPSPGPGGGSDPIPADPPVVTDENGDYSKQFVMLQNTPEAELMVRVGDIDNLNHGFETQFDPFSGNVTPPHSFPWELDDADPDGTDRIMVVSGYDGLPPDEVDGYTRETSRPENSVRAITLEYNMTGRSLAGALLQIFVDDLQAPRWGADYKVTLNGLRAPFMESRLNVLDQDGPVGQLISVDVPPEFMSQVSSGRLEIVIDDLTTGAGDGYAVDFVKLLVNPSNVSQTGRVVGSVVDAFDGRPIEGAVVAAGGSASDVTDANGTFLLESVPSGLAIVEVSYDGYDSLTQSVTLVTDEEVMLDFELSGAE